MAQALDRTIVSLSQAVGAGQRGDVRKLVLVARRQLHTLCGLEPRRKDSDVARKLAELRKEVGAPDTATVSGGLAYLRSEGNAPLGYRGVLNSANGGPDRAARDTAVRNAAQANAEAARAQARLAAAEREHELNEA